ncbi:MAG: hypothetical protein L0241_30165 [Planctomycetia bacterium]|nr:hypothetical protein [Planctomycetia bacterium]
MRAGHCVGLHCPSGADYITLTYALLGNPGDLASADPIRFDLLHRPDGRDVFLMQYSHALMDNGDAIPLLRELDQLSEPSAEAKQRAALPDLLAEHLRRFSRWRRLKAALRTLNVRFRKLRAAPATLGQDSAKPSAKAVQFRIATRRLERADLRALEQRVIRTCGVPSLSMALLGSVFRALEKCQPSETGMRRNLVAGIGVDLAPPGTTRPVFQTLASVVPIFVQPEALPDREVLTRTLHEQFRHQLETDADLGTVQLANFFQTPGAFLRERFARLSVRRLMRSGYSLWYAYFGSLDALGERFCGSCVEEVYSCASTWPPMGLTLLINRFRGDLLFQSTYVPESVPELLVNAFLDTIVGELVT